MGPPKIMHAAVNSALIQDLVLVDSPAIHPPGSATGATVLSLIAYMPGGRCAHQKYRCGRGRGPALVVCHATAFNSWKLAEWWLSGGKPRCAAREVPINKERRKSRPAMIDYP